MLREAGIVVLERDHAIVEVDGIEVGIAGLKGFVGGFDGFRIPDFGEPLLRALYDDTSARRRGARPGAARDRAVRAAHRPAALRAGRRPRSRASRREIWMMLGSERLAAPIAEHRPHIVLHGHAHAGTFAGRDRRGARSTTSRRR